MAFMYINVIIYMKYNVLKQFIYILKFKPHFRDEKYY